MFALRAAAACRTFAAGTVLVLVAACSGSAPAGSTTSSATSAASSTPTSSGGSGGPATSSGSGSSASAGGSVEGGQSIGTTGGGSTFSLDAKEYGFQGPASATAGVTTISLRNTGKEEHQAQLVKLNEGKSFSDLTAALAGGSPAAALAIMSLSGGPTGVEPGPTGEATENLAPGNYAFLCFI